MLPDNGKKVKQHLNYHITPDELKIFFTYIKKHCSTMYEIACLLMSTRGMRPQEVLAINILDFSKDFSRVTFREAKTNKLRVNEAIVSPVAKKVMLYVEMNRHRLDDGWLFPYYKKKVNGLPFMDSQTFASWFSKIRKEIGKEHPSFNEKYPFETEDKSIQYRYRIHPYSFRRFFETYFYIHNNYNLALLKEIMEYGSKFDPIKHYIRIVHREEDKADYLENTFIPISNMLICGQKQLNEFVKFKI